jgi:hypothetical protein
MVALGFAGGLSMPRIARLLLGLALSVATCATGSMASAQQSGSMVVGGTTITVGGGAQLLSLPDMKFTFYSSDDNGAALRKQKNGDLDEYGGAFVGSIETPLGHWGSTPVAGVVSGFFANVEDSDRKNCVSQGDALCTVENIIDRSDRPDSQVYDRFTTKTDRDVDYWGVGAEARFGKAPEPVPDSGGYLFRLAYVGIGGDVRGIDQDNKLRLHGDGPDANYSETLDTTYAGGFVSVGGEYNLLGYLGMGGSWGIRSLLSLRAGVYNASTDYSGRFSGAGYGSTRLGLSDDEVAFIGAASFETRKQFGPRTSLSLVTDYEYYSYAPEMRYVDADRSGCGFGTQDCAGRIKRTNIGDDDAFEVRTTLRLNIALGAAPVYAEPIK